MSPQGSCEVQQRLRPPGFESFQAAQSRRHRPRPRSCPAAVPRLPTAPQGCPRRGGCAGPAAQRRGESLDFPSGRRDSWGEVAPTLKVVTFYSETVEKSLPETKRFLPARSQTLLSFFFSLSDLLFRFGSLLCSLAVLKIAQELGQTAFGVDFCFQRSLFAALALARCWCHPLPPLSPTPGTCPALVPPKPE